MTISLVYVDPNNSTWDQFSDSVVSNTPVLYSLLPNVDEKYWRLWAEALSSVNDLAVMPPDHHSYDEWKPWAVDLMATY